MGKKEREVGKGENLILGSNCYCQFYKDKDYYVSLCWKYWQTDNCIQGEHVLFSAASQQD